MASEIWKKLNFKDEHRITILNAPDSFESEIRKLSDVQVNRKADALSDTSFLLAFATHRRDIEKISESLSLMAEGDVTVWFSYPKKSSKRYTCDFNRDTGWEPLGRAGFEGVRQVAIDEDWSAIRFRRVEYIRKMKRHPKRAVSREGKEKIRRQ